MRFLVFHVVLRVVPPSADVAAWDFLQTRACPTRPCYMASVRVTVPVTPAAQEQGREGKKGKREEAYVYTASINSNRDTIVRHDTPTMVAPCL